MNTQEQTEFDLTPAKATRNVPSYKAIAESLSEEIVGLRNEIIALQDQGSMNAFQEKAWSFQMPSSTNTEYLGLGLCGEAGEVASLLAKAKRDGATGAVLVGLNLPKELGDVLWFVAALATYHGLKMSDIANGNIDKLESRQARGVIGGSGDNR